MDCFEIKINKKLENFFLDLHEGLRDHYPEVYNNFIKTSLIKIAGWPTPNGDFIMLYHNDNYDSQHPDNRHKEIPKQTIKILIENGTEKITFFGDHNFLDRFFLPTNFYKTLEYENLVFDKNYERILLRNNKAKKRIRRQLKPILNQVEDIINLEKAFVEFVDNKGLIAIKEIDIDKYLAMDTKNRAYELIYHKPKREVKNEEMHIVLTNRSIIKSLDKSIEQALEEIRNQ